MLQQPEISWWTGRFIDDELENEFANESWNTHRIQTGLTLIGFSFAWLISLHVDFIYLTDTIAFYLALGVRLTSGCFGVLAGLWLLIARPTRNHVAPPILAYTWAALSAMTAVTVAFIYPVFETTADGLTDLLMFTFYWMSIQILGLGIALSAWPKAVQATALAYAIGYIALVSYWSGQLEHVLTPQIVVMIAACGFGVLLTILFSRRARQRYFITRLYEEQKIAAEKTQEFTTFLLAATGHDIRQPIFALNLNAAMLEDLIEDQDWEKAGQLARRQRQALAGVGNLISSVLELSHLDTERRDIVSESLDLDSIIEGVLTPLKPTAMDRDVSLRSVPTNLKVDADRGVVEHILANLIANAISHAQADTVLIGARRRDSEVDIMVIDDGQGLSNVLRTVTAADVQPGKTREGRRGLGVEIMFRLAEKAGLDLTLTSVPGKGVAAKLRCPRA